MGDSSAEQWVRVSQNAFARVWLRKSVALIRRIIGAISDAYSADGGDSMDLEDYLKENGVWHRFLTKAETHTPGTGFLFQLAHVDASWELV